MTRDDHARRRARVQFLKERSQDETGDEWGRGGDEMLDLGEEKEGWSERNAKILTSTKGIAYHPLSG